MKWRSRPECSGRDGRKRSISNAAARLDAVLSAAAWNGDAVASTTTSCRRRPPSVPPRPPPPPPPVTMLPTSPLRASVDGCLSSPSGSMRIRPPKQKWQFGWLCWRRLHLHRQRQQQQQHLHRRHAVMEYFLAILLRLASVWCFRHLPLLAFGKFPDFNRSKG